MFFYKKGVKLPYLGKLDSKLENRAFLFASLGWSIIPLKGNEDLRMPKAPAIRSWQAFQKRVAAQSEITSWFDNHDSRSIGIVLGKVSGLIVIDIDDEEQAVNFSHHFPEFANTLTVTSGNRNLPHYYYRISPNLFVPSRYGQGIELRSNGQYVVAPGSCVENRSWQVTHDVEPRILTENDLSYILEFLESTNHKKLINTANSPLNANMPISVDAYHLEISVSGLRKRYLRLAQKHGRNQALFSTALLGRDAGWSQSKVLDVLLHPHCIQPAADNHRSETYHQRKREAKRTVASVFSRLPRKLETHLKTKKPQQLPNTIRECLLQNNQVNVARVLDGLYMVGTEVGAYLTSTQIYESLKVFGVGRNTIFGVLKVMTDDGKVFFENMENSSPHTPHLSNAYAANRCAEQTNQCLIGRAAKSVKTVGRPSNLFKVPSVKRLCEILNVEDKGGDELQKEALRSPAAYREALHVALIERTPGKYPRKWLAERLGVSKDSCRRYEKRNGIQVVATFRDWFIGWHNVDTVLPDEPNPGQFIQDEKGKRYPALISVARMLLRIGRRITFRWQDANYYQAAPVNDMEVGVENTMVTIEHESSEQSLFSKIAAVVELQKPKIQTAVAVESPLMPVLETRSSLVDSDSTKMVSFVKEFRDKTQDESVVEFLYRAMESINSQRKITRTKARELVEQYGHSQIRRGVKLLRSRTNINNPTGFLITWLRSEQVMRA